MLFGQLYQLGKQISLPISNSTSGSGSTLKKKPTRIERPFCCELVIGNYLMIIRPLILAIFITDTMLAILFWIILQVLLDTVERVWSECGRTKYRTLCNKCCAINCKLWLYGYPSEYFFSLLARKLQFWNQIVYVAPISITLELIAF